MKPLAFPLLADQNVGPDVVEGLRARGLDVCTVAELGLDTASDSDILAHAHAESRVVVTHDRDFGKLAIARGEPLVGVVYLRPGHIEPTFVLEMLDELERMEMDVQPPFLVVVERRGAVVRTRLRRA